MLKIHQKIILLCLFLLIISYGICPCPSFALLKGYTIGPQDVLRIEIWDNPKLSREVTVAYNGVIIFPLLGEIEVEGYSCEQIQRIICTQLEDGYLVNPQVMVTVKGYNSKRIYVIGEVNRPGYYPFAKATTMIELITMAGGLRPNAGQEAYILRPPKTEIKLSQNWGRRIPEEKNHSPAEGAYDFNTDFEKSQILPNMETNRIIPINLNDFNQGINLHFPLQNDDIIYIPKVKFFYLLGEVKSPGRFKLEKDMSIRQAIYMAGGLTDGANGKRIKILRNIEGKEKKISVGMGDMILPNDIVKVPESFF